MPMARVVCDTRWWQDLCVPGLHEKTPAADYADCLASGSASPRSGRFPPVYGSIARCAGWETDGGGLSGSAFILKSHQIPESPFRIFPMRGSVDT